MLPGCWDSKPCAASMRNVKWFSTLFLCSTSCASVLPEMCVLYLRTTLLPRPRTLPHHLHVVGNLPETAGCCWLQLAGGISCMSQSANLKADLFIRDGIVCQASSYIIHLTLDIQTQLLQVGA